MSKVERLLLKAPGLLRTLAALFSGAAVVIPEVAPALLADPSVLHSVSGVLGLLGVIRAAVRKARS